MKKLLILPVILAGFMTGCAPSLVDLMPETPQATPTVTRTPAPTYPVPDLDDLIPLVKMIEAQRFPGLWDGYFDVLHAAGGSAVIIVNVTPSVAFTGNASYEVYPLLFKAMAQYMIDNFPGRQLRVLLTSVYSAYGPDGKGSYYQMDWSITVPPYLMQEVVDGAPKAASGTTPKPYDSEADYFWMVAGSEFTASRVDDILTFEYLVAWEDDAIPTRTPVPTPKPIKTATP